MDTTKITKEFWKIMKEFNVSNIEENVWKDTVKELLDNDSYSTPQLEKMYKEGVPEDGTKCFFGEDVGMVVLGYMLLMRYGLKEANYVNWCNKQKKEFRYLLRRLVGKDTPQLKTVYYTSQLEPLMIYFVQDKRKLFQLSTDVDGLFSLYGQTMCFHEKIKDIVQYYQFATILSEDMVNMFENQYNRMIHKFDDCTDYLMGIVKDVTEAAIRRVKEYIKDMEHSQEKVDESIEQYLDDVKGNTPYNLFLSVYAYIAEQYEEDAVKNEIRRLQRESVKFVGGGLGIRGMIAGSAQAAVTNKVYQSFLPHIASHSDRRIEYKMNAKKYQIFKEPEFLDEMKKITSDNVKSLCDFVLQGLPLGKEVSLHMPGECHNRIDELHKMAAFIGADDLKNAIVSVLRVYPFESDAYKLAYDILGDDGNELEILSMMFGVCEFYDYKLSKKPDGLSENIHRSIRKKSRFGFDKILESEQQISPILGHIRRVECFIGNGKPECTEVEELICQLLELMEESGISEGNKWISISAQTFYIQKKLYALLKKIGEMSCKNEEKEINFFDYMFSLCLAEYCGKFLNRQDTEKYTKDEVQEAIAFIKRNTIHEPDNWSAIIKYEDWICKELASMVKELQNCLEKLLKSLEEQEEEALRKEKEKEEKENRKNTYINLVKRFIERTPELFNLEFSNQFRWRFKYHSQNYLNRKDCVNEYDFELKDRYLRQFFLSRGEKCGQYVLFYNGSFILTDLNLYIVNNKSVLNSQKIALKDINEILVYKSIFSKKYLREIVVKNGVIPLNTESIDRVADIINLALDPLREKTYQTRYDKEGLRCGKCGSNNFKKGILRVKCLHCNNTDGEVIYEHVPSYQVEAGKKYIARQNIAFEYSYCEDERQQLLWLKDIGLPENNITMGRAQPAKLKPQNGEDSVLDMFKEKIETPMQEKSNFDLLNSQFEKKELPEEKQQNVIHDDWRDKKISSEASNNFSKRFQVAIKGTDIERFCVNEPIDQVHDKELYRRLNYMREKQPGQFVLYNSYDVVITDRFVIWGRLVLAIDELKEVVWKSNPSNSGSKKLLLILKNGEKYLVNDEGQQKTLSFVLNVALDTGGISIEEVPQKQETKDVFCTKCGKKIPRSSKFCTFCGAKNSH